MKIRLVLLIVLYLCAFTPATHAMEEIWPTQSIQLLQQARDQPDFAAADALHPAYMPTSDGKSFLAVWTPNKTPPQKWIVSLPGTGGYATKDLSVWAKHLQGRDVGLIVLQWWLGKGDTTADYYTPFDIYRELDIALNKLHIVPGNVMLHGFSRGSANIYAVAAIDRNKGRKYFNAVVANSGGASMNYPPTKMIVDGAFGKHPFAGTNWITSCGEKERNPERDGCPAMRRTGEWIESLGGKLVMEIEDRTEGHGALHRNPANAKRLLDWYMATPATAH